MASWSASSSLHSEERARRIAWTRHERAAAVAATGTMRRRRVATMSKSASRVHRGQRPSPCGYSPTKAHRCSDHYADVSGAAREGGDNGSPQTTRHLQTRNGCMVRRGEPQHERALARTVCVWARACRSIVRMCIRMHGGGARTWFLCEGRLLLLLLCLRLILAKMASVGRGGDLRHEGDERRVARRAQPFPVATAAPTRGREGSRMHAAGASVRQASLCSDGIIG